MSPAAERLWPVSKGARLFEGASDRLPDTARRYLDHAIAIGTAQANAVRLSMHGEIKLRKWRPFRAEQTLSAGRGMTWDAQIRMFGLPVTGFDRVVKGYGESQWKPFDHFPIASARGGDVSRSLIGRMAAESVWNPSVLLAENVAWTQIGPQEAQFRLTLFGHPTEVRLTLAASGRIETIAFERWGKPEGGTFGLHPFGGYVEEEKSFGGFTIPSKMRMGWHFGTGRFEKEGESFRATVDAAEYR